MPGPLDVAIGLARPQVKRQARGRDAEERLLVTALDPQSPASEAYRLLRTNLHFLGVERPLRRVLVTSALPEEGKTLTAANLAVAVAQAGRRVIVVDCDLRRPTLHLYFGVSEELGLTTVLAGEADVDRALLETPVAGLRLLPCGPLPPNPAELLGSARMAEVAELLAGQADLVIFDSPPLGLVTDAAALAAQSDGVVLVARSGWSHHPSVRQAKERLTNARARVLGVVLNAVPAGSDGYSRYYSYYRARPERPGARDRDARREV